MERTHCITHDTINKNIVNTNSFFDQRTANIDTLAADTGTIGTATITTASLTIISSSRIDGVGGYGNIIISGGLLPGTTNVFDLGSAAKSWKDLYYKSKYSIYVTS